MPEPDPKPLTRLPLGRTNRRLSYERRAQLWLLALTAPSVVAVSTLTYARTASLTSALAATAVAAVLVTIAAAYFFEQLVRPLQTLANVVAALREDDFSFRARGARRGDSLGDLALEINALASTLQTQRSAARDALTLVERVINSMQSPVLAFDAAGALRLLNPAAAEAFQLTRRLALGQPAEALALTTLLNTADEDLYNHPDQPLLHSPHGLPPPRRTPLALRPLRRSRSPPRGRTPRLAAPHPRPIARDQQLRLPRSNPSPAAFAPAFTTPKT